MRFWNGIALRLFRIGLIVVAVCAPDVLGQPVLVDDLVAALAHGLPEVGAVVLEAVALQHLQAAELALAHQASEVRDGRLRGKCTYDVHRLKRGTSLEPYRVTMVVAHLGWVDLDLGCSTLLLGSR